MCGIFGAVALKAPFDRKDTEIFQKLTDMVSYRGPDKSCFKIFSSHNNDSDRYNIFLGHRRLSIIDLSEEGSQPMSFDDISIIYNGEIFNYIELKQELENEGVHFRTKTDTEIIIRLYLKYGEKSFSRLNGMWAFILADHKQGRVIVSRDRFSIKPLFYLNKKGSYYFASEIKQLLPLLESREINKTVMYKFLLQSVTDSDHNTFFNGISKVKPKTNFIINLRTGEVSEEKYWDYEIKDIHFENVYEEFYELLKDSIAIRLRSDVEVGALLSGGLDSSAISVIADKMYSSPIQTYSVVSSDQNFSEEKFIDIMVNQKRLSNSKLQLNEKDVLGNLEKTLEAQDEPFGSFSIIAQYTVLDLIRKNSDIKVVLSGQGGDEVLLGYRKFYFFYLKDLLRKGSYGRAFAELAGSAVNRTVLAQYQFNLATRYLPFVNNSNRNFILLSGDKEPLWAFSSIAERQIMDIDKYSVPNLNRFEDRNSMAHSIETRTPFLDHRLVNFALSLAPEYKIKNGWTKYILRKSVTDLPKEIAWRRDKKSFVIPEDKWLKNELNEEIEKTFTNSHLSAFGVIDERKFLQYYNKYLRGNRGIFHSDISSVYIAEKWCRKYFSI